MENEEAGVDPAVALRHSVVSTYGMAEHLRDALHDWIDSVEKRLSAVGTSTCDDGVASLVERVSALENAVGAAGPVVVTLIERIAGLEKAIEGIGVGSPVRRADHLKRSAAKPAPSTATS